MATALQAYRCCPVERSNRLGAVRVGAHPSTRGAKQ
jgi:hypothetical protein